jgi:hypothetical protein
MAFAVEFTVLLNDFLVACYVQKFFSCHGCGGGGGGGGSGAREFPTAAPPDISAPYSLQRLSCNNFSTSAP